MCREWVRIGAKRARGVRDVGFNWTDGCLDAWMRWEAAEIPKKKNPFVSAVGRLREATWFM